MDRNGDLEEGRKKMMEPFLEKLARHIKDSAGNDTRDICIVLPNRRAGLFLKKHLASVYRKNIWAPTIFAIEDFIMQHGPYRQAEQATLLFELFKVHEEVADDKDRQTFEEIMAWGPILIDDFNELDLHLADAVQVFSYLEEEKALSLWHPDGSELTDLEKRYLSFFRQLLDYYLLFRKRLDEKKIAYQGMAYRHFKEHIETIAPLLPWKKIFFAGFNALTLSEEKVIRTLRDKGIGNVFWDADRYYLDDPDQEAGEFLRKYLSGWSSGNRNWIENGLIEGQKKIKVTGVAGNIMQVKLAGQFLSSLDPEESKPENTAVVLSDESLLIPVLGSIPEKYGDVNITMGYPLTLTPIFQLMNSIVGMHENAEKKAQALNSQRLIYSRDLIRVIGHHYFSLIYEEEDTVVSEIKKEILLSNKIFYSSKDITSILRKEMTPTVDAIFTPWETPGHVITGMRKVLEGLRDALISSSKKRSEELKLELEYVFYFSKIIRQLSDLYSEYGCLDSVRSVRKMLETLGKGGRVPFSGEPLKGLQVMGVLETRVLDFENIILLSVNENIIPAPRNYQSFIPFEIKKHFLLPTFREKDAIYAYHFYRMLQRAKNIHLIYNTEPDALAGGEKSRFITQLLHEMPVVNPGIQLDEGILHIPPGTQNISTTFTVPKSKEVLSALYEEAFRGFSPSSLSSYIVCPLQFYLRTVAGLEEEEDLEETIDAATLGNVVHEALQNLYHFEDKRVLNAHDLENKISQVPAVISAAFDKHYRGGDTVQGKNLLIFRIATLFTERFIRMEARQLKEEGSPLEILMLEKALDHHITVDDAGSALEVKIKGKIDRVDRFNGSTRIIDYKTGYVDAKDLKIDDWDKAVSDPKLLKAFQLMVYALLCERNGVAKPLTEAPGIISLRSPSKGLIQLSTPENNLEDSIGRFEEVLERLLQEIFDPSISFTQTEDTDNCKYCPYRELCRR